MKKQTTFIILLLLSLIANGLLVWKLNCKPVNVETTIETVYDTIPLYYKKPIPVDSNVIRYIDVKLPTAKDTVYLTSIDSVQVSVPITQKYYEAPDSTYKAWVSGFQANLDSIYVFQPTKTTTITKTLTQYKTKRWGVGIQAGVGITPERVQPYIGIGISYNIFSF